ncbi:Rhomboid family protein [Flavobacterium psychrophilum]|jgi:membrane associated rhomboid family serine protease|nr:Rhomboid family protein [Flavobacterium psychrophilum]SNB02005.1 Rhomboid family protein [Flavobacterium psychrophilum]
MMNNMTPTVKQLLIINIIFFLGSIVVPNAEHLLALYYFENPSFKIWQPVTHMFMHGGLMHIAFNMFALVSFGSLLENIWGGKKFLFFYFSCGLGAALVHSGMNYYYFHDSLNILTAHGNTTQDVLKILADGKYNTSWQEVLSTSQFDNLMSSFSVPAVGASGAIYGLLIAFAFMFPNAELALMFIPVPVKAKYFVPIFMLLYDGLFGIFGNSFFGINSGVAHYAHIGGALIGFIIMWYWKKNAFNNKRWN